MPAIAAPILAGVAAILYTYLASGAIENDHFVMLARAHQVLYGDWPVRDFEDPGMPLAYLVSAAAAAVFGPTLLVNVILSILLFGMAVGVTFALARDVSNSTIGALAAAVTILVYPRLYNTTKVLVPVIAMALAWRYARHPSNRRVVGLALWTAVAFLLRHDYATYVGLSNVVLLTLAHRHNVREAARAVVLYVALSSIFVAPWLAYVEWNEGLADYFAAATRFTAGEARRTATTPPQWPFYALVAIPLLALATCRRLDSRAVPLAAAAVLLLVMNIVFLRDAIAARVADVVAPTAIVAAAVAGRLLSRFPARTTRVAVLVGALVVASVAITTHRISTPTDVFSRPLVVTARLRSAAPEIQPVPARAPLITFLDRCTNPAERILVGGFAPEIPVLAHRAFAAGLPAWIPGYYEHPDDVARAIHRLDVESVGAVVLLGAGALRPWPALDEWVRGHGFEEYAVQSIDPRLRVWLPRRPPASIDAATMLPCGS